jgi:preprotein translocase subunit SecG
MWYTILTVIHIFSCLFLTAVVLLQTGKGSDMGAVFGGSSQTIFGSSGAGNLLTKLTSATAIVFMLTSLTLTYGAAKQTSKSVFDNAPVSTPVPAVPGNAPAAQPDAATEGQPAATAPTGEATQPADEPAQPAPVAPESAPAATEQSPPSASAAPPSK